MTNESDPATPEGEPAGEAFTPGRRFVEDEMQRVFDRARDRHRADLIELLTQPRRP